MKNPIVETLVLEVDFGLSSAFSLRAETLSHALIFLSFLCFFLDSLEHLLALLFLAPHHLSVDHMLLVVGKFDLLLPLLSQVDGVFFPSLDGLDMVLF